MQYSANDFAKYWKSIDDIVIPTKDDLLVNKSYRKAIYLSLGVYALISIGGYFMSALLPK